MPNPRTQAARERERRAARRQEELRRAARRTRRKQLAVGIFGVTLIVALVAGLVVAGTRGTTTTTAPSSTTTSAPGDLSGITVPEGEPVNLPPVAPGAALTGPTPCPAADGSSPRTTSFEQAPPTCTQADRNYNAVVHTSEGDLTLLLNTRQAPVGVNNFVVLARYHFWDGAPITNIEPRVAFQVQGFIDGSTPSPGYTIANEAPPEGTLQIVGNPSFVVPQAGDGTVIDPGRFQMALGEEAAGLPRNTPVLGILLDDGARDGGDVGTLQKIRRAGSTTGAPTRVITISSIDVTEEPAGTA